jgi:hypothetical protein
VRQRRNKSGTIYDRQFIKDYEKRAKIDKLTNELYSFSPPKLNQNYKKIDSRHRSVGETPQGTKLKSSILNWTNQKGSSAQYGSQTKMKTINQMDRSRSGNLINNNWSQYFRKPSTYQGLTAGGSHVSKGSFQGNFAATMTPKSINIIAAQS